MTDTHDKARKALAEITAIEGVTDGNWSIIKCLGARFIDALDLDSGMDTPVAIMQGKEGGANAAHIAACDPATMQAIAALVAYQDAQIAALRGAGVHLLSRIDDWEDDRLDGSGEREWHGHVVPAIERLDIAIRAMGGKADE